MAIMEQIESFESLSIAYRKYSQASSCSSSDLTWMSDSEAKEPTPGSPPSSSESSPLMTPDTSDDEGEDLLPLPEPMYRNSSGSGQDLSCTPVAALEQYRDGDEDLTPSSKAAHPPFDDEHEDLLATLAMVPESSEDEDEIVDEDEDDNEDEDLSFIANEIIKLLQYRKKDKDKPPRKSKSSRKGKNEKPLI